MLEEILTFLNRKLEINKETLGRQANMQTDRQTERFLIKQQQQHQQ